MRNLLKKWALVAAVFGTSLLFSSCPFGGDWKLIAAWLNEDLFG